LEFENGESTVVLPFYERTIDDIRNLKWLESKARNWQMMLSKMLQGKIAGSSTTKDNLN